MDSRYLARTMSITRMAIGVALVASPRRLAAGLIGSELAGPSVGVITRAMGARDLVLGQGTFEALGSHDAGPDARRWVQLSAAVDAIDAVAILAAFGSLPRGRRTAVLAVAAGAAIVGARAATELEAGAPTSALR